MGSFCQSRLSVYVFLLIGLIGVMGCNNSGPEHNNRQAYYQELSDWRVNRIKSLTASNGWTTLAGLFWLEEGDNSFGSDVNMDLVFPKPMPMNMGILRLENDQVYFKGDHQIEVHNAESLDKDEHLIYSQELEDPAFLTWKSYRWFVIKRGPKFGIRLRDSLHKSRFDLEEIPHYTDDLNWRFEATISYQDTNHILSIDNMVGITNEIKVAATLTFQVDQQVYELYAIPGGAERYFVIFADQTTGEGTYHGGRYLYPTIPTQGNTTFLDFNQAINPPCVFTEFATCPLPPKENVLPFAITAGEKYFKFSNE